MINLNKIRLENSLIILGVALSYTTYVTQYFLNVPEIIAEGFPLALIFVGLSSLVVLSFNNSKISDIRLIILSNIYIIYITILSIVTLYYIIVDNRNPITFLFLYQYLVPLYLILLYKSSDFVRLKLNIEFILKLIVLMAVISGVFGIIQFLGFDFIIPIDIHRSRGMSRSTLNYSSLMLLGFIASLAVNNSKIKIIAATIIFMGILTSQGRGGIFSATIFLALYLVVYKNNYKNFFIFCTAIVLFLIIIIFFNSNESSQIILLSKRLLDGFDIENDIGNSQRILSYIQILNEFILYGGGFGSTGPGAGRFNYSATGFESFILALIYQGGIFSILLIIYSVMYIYINYKNKFLLCTILSILFMAIVQQTMETPTVYILVWLILFLVQIKFNNNK
jgi:hypothetical protein